LIEDALYVSGSINNRITLFKFKNSDLSYVWSISVKDMASISNQVQLTMISYSNSLSGNTFVGCAENLGSNTNSLAFIYITELLNFGPNVM